MAPARFPRLVASAARRPRTKRRRRKRPTRVGSRPPARVRPPTAIRAKRRPSWRIEGGPRTGRPRTTRLPTRERRRRLPPRSRHRRRPPPPPRLPGSRRHLALRRLPISAPPRSGPHLPPTAIANPRPRPRHRGPGSATRRPVASGVGESRRPRRRPLLFRRPPRIRRAGESLLTSGRATRRSRLASSLQVLAGRRTPPGPLRDPSSNGRPARRRRHCRPDRPRLRLPGPVSRPDRILATMPRAALATRRRPGPLGPEPRVPAGRMSVLQPLRPSTDPRPPRPGTPFTTTWGLRRRRRPASPPMGLWMRRRLGPSIDRCLPDRTGRRPPSLKVPSAAMWTRRPHGRPNGPGLHGLEMPAADMWMRRCLSGPATHERVAR
jgi:hypothetical protein